MEEFNDRRQIALCIGSYRSKSQQCNNGYNSQLDYTREKVNIVRISGGNSENGGQLSSSFL